jgi:7-cyano-7-deazaguanine synthase
MPVTTELDGKRHDAALVLFSGGQDSATCLAWALQNYAHVETIGFDYGQRHRIELSCRETFRDGLARAFPHWARGLGEDHLLDLRVLGAISDTALTSDAAIRYLDGGLPNTFVPGRNLLFFTFAASVAYRRGLRALVGGMCETDYSGYPDCRNETLRSLETTLNLGTAHHFDLVTPLMWLDKAQTWELARSLGGDVLVQLIVDATHTCYLGERGTAHAWGAGCGHCPACELRRTGWERWRESRSASTPAVP